MSAALAYMERDFRVAWTYRSSFFIQYLLMPFNLIGTRFLADLVGPREALAQYGGDYFAFALIGTALQIAMYPCLTVFRGAVREAQVLGTLEAILMTRTRPASSVAYSGLYQLLQLSVQPIVIIPIVGVVLGAHFAWSGAPAALAVLLLALVGFAGMGLCSAAFTIAFKQNEPFTVGLVSVSTLLSGVIFPIELLPEPLRWVSLVLPLTHAAEAIRGTFIANAAVTHLELHIAVTAAFAAFLPLGLFAVSRAFGYARDRGSLGQY